MSFEFSTEDQTLAINNYDNDGVYLSTIDALIKAGTGLPAKSTQADLPDLEDNQVAVYDSDTDAFIATYDYRDQTVYSTTDMTESTVDYLGDITDGYTLISPSTAYDAWDEDTETWVTDTDAQTEAENQATYKTEYEWAASELSDTDVEVAKCTRSSSRAIGTKYEWYAYQEALCDYAHYSSDDGYSITDMTSIDEKSDDYKFKYEYDEVEYIVSVDSGTGRPVAPS